MDSNNNRVAGLAMHPVDQRKGEAEESRKGGGTTVAEAAPPAVLNSIFLLFLPLAALLILH